MLPALGRTGFSPGRLLRTRSPIQKWSATEVRGRTPASRSASGAPRAPVTPCAHRSIGSNRPPDRTLFILPIPNLGHASDPILRFASPYLRSALLLPGRTSIICEQFLAASKTWAHVPWGPRRRHAHQPCNTGPWRLHFVCWSKPLTAGVPLGVAPRIRRRATSGGPAGRSGRSGCGGSRFYFLAIRPRHAQCVRPVRSQTLQRTGAWAYFLVSEQPLPGITGASSRGPQPTGPVVHNSMRATHSTRRQAVWAPGRCGSRGSSPVRELLLLGVNAARDWSRSASLAPRVTAFLPESGGTPGPPSRLGSFFSHRITVFPSFGTPPEFLIRGQCCLHDGNRHYRHALMSMEITNHVFQLCDLICRCAVGCPFRDLPDAPLIAS